MEGAGRTQEEVTVAVGRRRLRMAGSGGWRCVATGYSYR